MKNKFIYIVYDGKDSWDSENIIGIFDCKTEEEVCEELSKFAYNDIDRNRYKNNIDLNIVRNRLFYKDKE